MYADEDTGALEEIIRSIKAKTTSEIMLLNHHIAWYGNRDSPKNQTLKDDNCSQLINHLAQKYGCELVDVQMGWRAYLTTNKGYDINNLMVDEVYSNVHPNNEGNLLLKDSILRHFRFNLISHQHYNRGWSNQIMVINLK
jgi:hypothetical protein